MLSVAASTRSTLMVRKTWFSSASLMRLLNSGISTRTGTETGRSSPAVTPAAPSKRSISSMLVCAPSSRKRFRSWASVSVVGSLLRVAWPMSTAPPELGRRTGS